jgi:metallo-beta-lactamase class B
MHIVYADSLTAMAAEGRSFSRNPLYPTARTDIERSIATIEGLECDVLVSAHPDFSDVWERKARATFVDHDACRAYGAKARTWLAKTLAAEAQP